MNTEEIRELSSDELLSKQAEIKEQIFRLRFQIDLGQTDGVKKYRALKKDLARVLTISREQETAENEGSN
ncbi:MAG: 50S ribosomal protein L29 [Solibacterales bacterium]|nr:50S ribosomal protein L29 [Bryobacterales bacterium]|tara:strand:+ start:111 stop:320 length:210 start_codon:yes stop_codon:yes gene_type:complete